MTEKNAKTAKTEVASHLSAKIHYKENREIEAQDIGHVCSLYEIELKGVVVAIALGRARMDKGDVMYCPIYGVGDEEGEGEEGEEGEGGQNEEKSMEPKMPIVKVQLGVIEAPASAAVNILGKAALLSKKGVGRRPDMAVTDYDVPLDIMGDILLYEFVNEEFLRSLKSRPETYHLPTFYLTESERNRELEKEEALEKALDKALNKEKAPKKEEGEDDDIFDILAKEEENVLLPSAKKIEESMQNGVFRDVNPGFVRPPYLNEETHKIAKQKKQEYKESPRDSWIQKFMRNSDFAIVDVADNGDCFFDTVVKAFASVGRITDVATLRALVAKNATEAIFREFVTFYTQLKQQEEQSIQEIRGIKKDIDALTKAHAETSAINALIEQYNSKIKIHKKQKEHNREIIAEFKYMETIKSLEDFRAFILTPAFWADAWVIGLLEKELRFKAIIFGEENFEDGSRDSVMQCGGWSESDKIEPEFYIMTTYSGNHYRLISYMGTRIFTFREIPYDVKTLIMHKCMERNAGDYDKIAEFRDWKGRFTSSSSSSSSAADESIKSIQSVEKGEANYDKTIVFKFYESSPS
jgi:CheY-like chemotaxis protein